MSTSPEEIIRRTQEMLLQSQENAPSAHTSMFSPVASKIDLALFQEQLPDLEEGQFLIDASTSEERAIFCVRELYWHEAQEIELRSFRLNERNDHQFAGEYERRETLKKAIAWGCVLETPVTIHYNDAYGAMLKKVSATVIDLLWKQYQLRVTLGSEEATALYNAAQSYFRGDAQTGMPVPPLVIEVDFWMKGVQWTREDFRRVSMSDLERIQLILAARSDVLGVSATKPTGAAQGVAPSEVMTPELLATFPPHIRQRLGG